LDILAQLLGSTSHLDSVLVVAHEEKNFVPFHAPVAGLDIGANFFKNVRFVCKYVASTLANEVITTYGVVKEKTPKGNGFRFKVEFWASNEEGQTKTIGWTEVDVGV
jgi:hypothetical protein